MNIHADKTQEYKNQSVANGVAQRKSSSETAFQFVDNRPETIVQRKLQETINSSSQSKQTAQLQTITDSYAAKQHQPLQKKENNTGLPDNLKSGIEHLSGYSMDDVKVHYNSDKPAQLQAHAYAQGTDIHLAPRQEKHLPHEAWHVVQQKQGRVKPTMQLKGKVNINDDKQLEREADVMGEKSYQFSSVPAIKSLVVQSFKSTSSMLVGAQLKLNPQNTIIQRQWDYSGEEPIYVDKKRQVTWHLTSDNHLWFEQTGQSNSYNFVGIENKASFAVWIMGRNAPLDLLAEEAKTAIEVPHSDQLLGKYHDAYKLYVYIIRISKLKWDDIKNKSPFKELGWKRIRIYDHYSKYVDKNIRKEDEGINAYYGPFYKIINPFLRAVRIAFGDQRYDEILAGDLGSDKAELIAILQTQRDKNKFNGDADEAMLLEMLASVKGATKEIEKNSEINPVNVSHVYRGDSIRTVARLGAACVFDPKDVDEKGELVVNKPYTQYQFVSTTVNKTIGPPASTGTLWNIKIGSHSTAQEGGLYSSEREVLFANKSVFFIEKIVTAARYKGDGVKLASGTKYVVYASQG